MAAHHHLNPNQMRMFMRPGEIKAHIGYSIDDMPVGADADWEEKDHSFLSEASSSSSRSM